MARAQLTERDRRLLQFAAEHRLFLAVHVEVLVGISRDAARTRLRTLTRAGYLRHEKVFHRQPGCFQATRRGLALVDRPRSPRPIDPAQYDHDVGLAWLWLHARCEAFGPMREVIAERRMRSHDATRDRTAEPVGVDLGGFGVAGRRRLHYPDLMLVTPEGKRIAVELELTGKGRARREKILAGYAGDGRIDAVLYMVEHGNHELAERISASARRAGIGSIVHVQPFRWGGASGRRVTGPALERTAAREPGLER